MVKTLLLTSTSVSTVKRSKCTIVIKSAISDKHSNEIFILKFERWLNKYSVYSRFTNLVSIKCLMTKWKIRWSQSEANSLCSISAIITIIRWYRQ